jgi:hypothetical protein
VVKWRANPPGFARFFALCATSVPNSRGSAFWLLDASLCALHLGASDMTTVPEGLAAALADRYRIERELGAGGMATVQVGVRFWRGFSRDRAAVVVSLSASERNAALGDESFAYFLAAAYALVEETDQALTWLEHAVRVRGWFDYVYFTKYDPFLQSLHDHPRFQALMAEAKERYDRFDV